MESIAFEANGFLCVLFSEQVCERGRESVYVCIATTEHPVNVKLGIGPLLNFELAFAKCNAASGSLSFYSVCSSIHSLIRSFS